MAMGHVHMQGVHYMPNKQIWAKEEELPIKVKQDNIKSIEEIETEKLQKKLFDRHETTNSSSDVGVKIFTDEEKKYRVENRIDGKAARKEKALQCVNYKAGRCKIRYCQRTCFVLNSGYCLKFAERLND